MISTNLYGREAVRLDRASFDVDLDEVTVYNPGQVQSCTTRTSAETAFACVSWYVPPAAVTALTGGVPVDFERPVVRSTHLRAELLRAARDLPVGGGDLSAPPSLADLAEGAGMSREHLIWSFTSATGCPPYAWHLQARLAEGRRRLRHGQAVADVAHALGFADLPADMLRPAVLSGVERLLEGPSPSRPAPRAPGRRRGWPGAMTPEAVETARRMHASGEHTAAEIARTLGVSRATLYRHLADEFRDTIRDTFETPACRRDQRSRGSRPVRRSTAGRGPKRLTA